VEFTGFMVGVVMMRRLIVLDIYLFIFSSSFVLLAFGWTLIGYIMGAVICLNAFVFNATECRITWLADTGYWDWILELASTQDINRACELWRHIRSADQTEKESGYC